MSKPIVQKSFSSFVDQFTIKDIEKTLQYRTERISHLLVEERTYKLLKEALSENRREKRLDAITELGKWGRSEFEIEVLRKLSISEHDLEVKLAAANAITRISTRL